MKKPTRAEMSEDDWENLRNQLRTLVDIYCKQNDEMIVIKQKMNSLVGHVSNLYKALNVQKNKTNCWTYVTELPKELMRRLTSKLKRRA